MRYTLVVALLLLCAGAWAVPEHDVWWETSSGKPILEITSGGYNVLHCNWGARVFNTPQGTPVFGLLTGTVDYAYVDQYLAPLGTVVSSITHQTAYLEFHPPSTYVGDITAVDVAGQPFYTDTTWKPLYDETWSHESAPIGAAHCATTYHLRLQLFCGWLWTMIHDEAWTCTVPPGGPGSW